MEFFNSLNLTQIKGGTKLKQGDLGSVLSYSLTDENGQEITSFDNKTAYINLVLDDKIWFTTTTLVDISRVTFRIDKPIPIGLYYLEIKIDDYIFPSDRDSIILIEEGSTPYDLKELVPNYDINMTLKGILSDLSQKGIDITDLNRRIGNANAELIAARNGKSNLKTRIDDLENKTTEQLAKKANKDEVTNVMTPKGTLAYASLPTSGNQVGWYYYCPDGDGTHGAGNYVWNGTSWYFGGTGDEGYNLLKKDLVELDSQLSESITDVQDGTMDVLDFNFLPCSLSTDTSGDFVYKESNNRASSEYIPVGSIVEFDASIKISFRYYDEYGYLKSSSAWITESPHKVQSEYRYVRMQIAYADDRVIANPNELKDLITVRSYDAKPYVARGALGTAVDHKWFLVFTHSKTRAVCLPPKAIERHSRISFDSDYSASVRFIRNNIIVNSTGWIEKYIDLDAVNSVDYDSVIVVFKRIDNSELTDWDLQRIEKYTIVARYSDAVSYEFSHSGSYINPNVTTYSNTGKIPCVKGDIFQFRARVKGAYAIVAYDDNNNIVDSLYFTSNARTIEGYFTAKSTWKYVFCNTMNNTHTSYEKYVPMFEKVSDLSKLVFDRNYTIKCAKECTYKDGTLPTVEWYLLNDVCTGMFYKSKDLINKEYLFTFVDDNPLNYSFGVTANGDIVAVFKTESLEDLTTHDDGRRKNPYVWLKKEGYRFAHEVDFGTRLKPSGWLSNTGFRVTPNGTVLFCEYTRPSVASANAWRIEKDADITNPLSWNVVKSFALSGDKYSGFKHCHMIMCDHYTGVIYLSTGDDNIGSQVWHSFDDGKTWIQTTTPSEKYCRMLNYVFTKDCVYWASDTAVAEYHYIFKANRNVDGVIDYNTVEDVELLPYIDTRVATYGIVYIEELNLLLLCERVDGIGNATEMPIRAYDLTKNQLVVLGNIYSADGTGHNLGFRTEYTEWYPKDGKVKFGFGGHMTWNSASNFNKVGGNLGTDSIEANVNIVSLKPFIRDNKSGFVLDKIFIE